MAGAAAIASASVGGATQAGLVTPTLPAQGSCSPRSPIRSMSPTSASGEDPVDNLQGAREEPSPLVLERRELLAAGMAGISLLSPGSVLAAPIKAPVPVLTKCVAATVEIKDPVDPEKTNVWKLKCCPPNYANAKVTDFKLPDSPPERVRVPAHSVSEAYKDKYNKAYAAMRALDDDDPRSLTAQAKVHCAYCNGAYVQEGEELQIHDSWLFFPFHRWYLYFHEKILGSLIGDPTFALPFWNWDNQVDEKATLFPALLNGQGTAAWDDLRNPDTLKLPSLLVLNCSGTPEDIKKTNLSAMHQSVVRSGSWQTFMGKPYYLVDSNPTWKAGYTSSLESGPHTAIHVWIGKPGTPYGQDLGNFSSAGNDPAFYSHHSNVDRLWDVWRGLSRRHTNPTDRDFLDTEFVFYDENKNLMKVRVEDSLDSDKLGTVYKNVDDSDDACIYFAPSATLQTCCQWFLDGKGEDAAAGSVASADEIVELGPAERNTETTSLKGKPFTVHVARALHPPAELRQEYEAGELQEVLLLQGVEMPANKNVHFDVFVDYPEADENSPIYVAEYVGGSFQSLPHVGAHEHGSDSHVANASFGIDNTLKLLNLTAATDILVTVVPRGTPEEKDIFIRGITILYM